MYDNIQEGTLIIVMDESGNLYIPALGIDEINELEPGKAYQIYVNQAQTFTYPAN